MGRTPFSGVGHGGWGDTLLRSMTCRRGNIRLRSRVERETWCCWWQLGEAGLEKGLCTDLSNGHCRTQDMTGKETQDFQVQA